MTINRVAVLAVLVFAGWFFFEPAAGILPGPVAGVLETRRTASKVEKESEASATSEGPQRSSLGTAETRPGKSQEVDSSTDIPDDRPLPAAKRRSNGLFERTLGEHFRSHPATAERILHLRQLGRTARKEVPVDSDSEPKGAAKSGDVVDVAVDLKNRFLRVGSEVFGEVVGPLSLEQEWELGDEVHRQLMATMDVDQAESQRIEKLATPLLDFLQRTKGKAYTFTVIRDPQINAFAHHGGHIYVKTGLLTALRHDHELLFVLGHEVGHVERGHCAKSALSQDVSSRILGGYGELPATLLQRFVGLGYSEFDEHDADAWSYTTLRKLGVPERDIVEFFYTLMQHESDSAAKSDN